MDRLMFDDADLKPDHGIYIGRWERQYPGLAGMPFGAMWFEVPAGGESALDCHPEFELAVVVDGTATFSVNGHDSPAPAGTAILLRPGEKHVVKAAAGRPARILSLYWMPPPQGDTDAA